ncbi:hypothetical protein BKA66DRAFT_573438 [Pyrenochaeta sp. MPI-SDFR-AT-0127]|nr:hypothetical protein BKA66DRAFT_573438 [Pyrenochaeta sp. MPI-SDFR-AT-0127]
MDLAQVKPEPSCEAKEPELLSPEAIKLEVEEHEGIKSSISHPQVDNSVSSLPSMEGHPALQTEGDSLRKDLTSQNEYAVLQESHCKLVDQLRKLCQLCSAYTEVIYGFSSHENRNASISQLRAEAGRDGLRAKALETEILRPIINDAGGLQAFISQAQIVRSLIGQTGGLQGLEKAVSQANIKVDETEGLHTLGLLVAEVNILRAKQREYDELRCTVDGPNGLKFKAACYEKLEQLFAGFQNISAQAAHQHTGPANASVNGIVATYNAPVESIQNQPHTSSVSTGAATINPARASRISATRIEDDPDRDLYEATPLVTEPRNRTGSNKLPLGKSQPASFFFDMTNRRIDKEKKEHNGLWINAVKRPRIDGGHASASVQASFAGNSIRDHTHAGQAQTFSGKPQFGDSGVQREKAERVYRQELEEVAKKLQEEGWIQERKA